jgi:hypothetical protein
MQVLKKDEISTALKKEAADLSERTVPAYQTVLRHTSKHLNSFQANL